MRGFPRKGAVMVPYLGDEDDQLFATGDDSDELEEKPRKPADAFGIPGAVGGIAAHADDDFLGGEEEEGEDAKVEPPAATQVDLFELAQEPVKLELATKKAKPKKTAAKKAKPKKAAKKAKPKKKATKKAKPKKK